VYILLHQSNLYFVEIFVLSGRKTQWIYPYIPDREANGGHGGKCKLEKDWIYPLAGRVSMDVVRTSTRVGAGNIFFTNLRVSRLNIFTGLEFSGHKNILIY
jgi:hypothetical protein